MVEAQFPLMQNLDPLLAGVLATALQGEPGLRYGSVEQLSAALTGLAAALKGQQVKALPAQRAAGERSGGNSLRRVLALLGLAVVGAIIIYLLIVLDQSVNLGALFSGPAGTVTPATAPTVAVVLPRPRRPRSWASRRRRSTRPMPPRWRRASTG